jgi:uncharacterized protein (DUF302 family)
MGWTPYHLPRCSLQSFRTFQDCAKEFGGQAGYDITCRRADGFASGLTELRMPAEGLVTARSQHGPEETMNRLGAAVRAKGLTVFAQIDHAAGAEAVGLPLRPTEVLVFGNAGSGTPLMKSSQTMGIDLPLKVLVWQDEAGVTWLSYDDPDWLARRHGLDDQSRRVIDTIKDVISSVVLTASS